MHGAGNFEEVEEDDDEEGEGEEDMALHVSVRITLSAVDAGNIAIVCVIWTQMRASNHNPATCAHPVIQRPILTVEIHVNQHINSMASSRLDLAQYPTPWSPVLEFHQYSKHLGRGKREKDSQQQHSLMIATCVSGQMVHPLNTLGVHKRIKRHDGDLCSPS